METTIFKNKSLEKRRQLYESIMRDNTDKIPVIVDPYDNKTSSPLKKNKLLLNYESTTHDLLRHIKKRLPVKPSESIFLYCNNTILPADKKITEIYNDYKNKEDNFLYVQYKLQDTMG